VINSRIWSKFDHIDDLITGKEGLQTAGRCPAAREDGVSARMPPPSCDQQRVTATCDRNSALITGRGWGGAVGRRDGGTALVRPQKRVGLVTGE
jgi:hypothetical protein